MPPSDTCNCGCLKGPQWTTVNRRESHPPHSRGLICIGCVEVPPLTPALPPAGMAHGAGQCISKTTQKTSFVRLLHPLRAFRALDTHLPSVQLLCVQLSDQAAKALLRKARAFLKPSPHWDLTFCCEHTGPKGSPKTACWEAGCY